jgi:hypothetical protein
VWQGTWAGTTTFYYVNDAVEYNGSSYICIADTTVPGSNPATATTEWDLLASKGDTGSGGSASAAVDAAGKIYAYRGFR